MGGAKPLDFVNNKMEILMDRSQSSLDSIVNVVRWTARVFGGLLILMCSFFFLGEVVFDDSHGVGSLSPDIMKQFLLMAIVLVSYGTAWKKELVGGSIALLAFTALDIINPDVLSAPIMYVFPLTAILFLFCGLWSLWHRLTARTAARATSTTAPPTNA